MHVCILLVQQSRLIVLTAWGIDQGCGMDYNGAAHNTASDTCRCEQDGSTVKLAPTTSPEKE